MPQARPLPRSKLFAPRKRGALRPRHEQPTADGYQSRYTWLLILFILAFCIMAGRALYLHVMHKSFLQSQGDARLMRIVPIAAHRGMFLDRRGEPLAMSSPVDSVWVNPAEVIKAHKRWGEFMALLDMTAKDLDSLLEGRRKRRFVYVKRHIEPYLATQISALDLPGIFLQREYKRFYPAAEVTAHALGFTDIDDQGQEGLELAFEDGLRGIPGSKRVIQDRAGQVIEDVEHIRDPRPGTDIRLSLDRRIAYLAYRELTAAVLRHKAQSGSIIVVDTRSGEVLAMNNQPAYNPNKRTDRNSAHYRNRVVTDVFEPGSTIKPFTVAAALESGLYNLNSQIKTAPGSLQVGHYTIRDARNYGTIDLSKVLYKSSNVGAAKIALSLPKEELWKVLSGVGFGAVTGSAFPGEVSGNLTYFNEWLPTKRAGLGFGYGLNVTLLQLAQAYSVLANNGVFVPLRFTALGENEKPLTEKRVFSSQTAEAVRTMLTRVVSPGGTGSRAQVANYSVAGKTGTVHKAVAGGYATNRYLSLFAGLAPAGKPRLAVIVLINEPSGDTYYGGEVAAPVFARVMAGSLRLLDVTPDK